MQLCHPELTFSLAESGFSVGCSEAEPVSWRETLSFPPTRIIQERKSKQKESETGWLPKQLCHPELTFSLAQRKSKQKEIKTGWLPKQLCHPEFISGSSPRKIIPSPENIKNIPSTSHAAKRHVRGDSVPQKESEIGWLPEQLCHPESCLTTFSKIFDFEKNVRFSAGSYYRHITTTPENINTIPFTSHTAQRHVRGDYVPRKAAFTLAEVLITLGIIGVVAAMTLPTVINNTQNKELEAALKKSYSALSQVTMRVINEDLGGVIDSRSVYDIRNHFVKYYKGAALCKETSSVNNCPPSKDICSFLEATYKNYNGKSRAVCLGNDALTNTIDGTTVYFDKADFAAETPEAVANKFVILIDVNGWQRKPNKLGHDMFVFEITREGKLLPMGAENTVYSEDTYCSLSSDSRRNGFGCTSKALSHKDYFKNLPR